MPRFESAPPRNSLGMAASTQSETGAPRNHSTTSVSESSHGVSLILSSDDDYDEQPRQPSLEELRACRQTQQSAGSQSWNVYVAAQRARQQVALNDDASRQSGQTRKILSREALVTRRLERLWKRRFNRRSKNKPVPLTREPYIAEVPANCRLFRQCYHRPTAAL